MKTLAYLDCVTGIAGDMCLGALVHAGVPLDYLTAQLDQLGVSDEFGLRAEKVQRNGQSATKVFVDVKHSHDRNHDRHHGGRRLPDIEAMIEGANLPERVETWSLAVFRLLAKAEAAVHGIPPEKVHFHEVGATDAIVDIVGTCLGLDWLGIEGLVCSPLPTGSGTVRCEHGLLPVPAPAVLNMMAEAQMPVYSNGIERELVTPTGCAIATTLSSSFGPPPKFTLQKIGLGAGGRDLKLPNILRLWIGTVDELPESAQAIHVHEKPPETETIVTLQTQLDDLSPQVIGYVFDLLFSAGAVDVFTQSVLMKKNRPGTLMTVLCHEADVAACESVLFRETTTLGIRRTEQMRSVLEREMVKVETKYGAIAVKVAKSHGKVVNVQPEFEDCAEGARSHQVPLQRVQREAIAAATLFWRDPVH